MKDREQLLAILRQEEGLRLTPYSDTTGHLTVGYGHRTDYRTNITRDVAEALLEADADNAIASAERLPVWPAVEGNAARECAVVNMVFNLGAVGTAAFKKFAAAALAGRWTEAAAEILDSRAAVQAPNRYQRIATAILTGKP